MRHCRQLTLYHIERSTTAWLGLPQYPCGCRQCCGVSTRGANTVARHHHRYGRDLDFPYSLLVNQDTLLLCSIHLFLCRWVILFGVGRNDSCIYLNYVGCNTMSKFAITKHNLSIPRVGTSFFHIQRTSARIRKRWGAWTSGKVKI